MDYAAFRQAMKQRLAASRDDSDAKARLAKLKEGRQGHQERIKKIADEERKKKLLAKKKADSKKAVTALENTDKFSSIA